MNETTRKAIKSAATHIAAAIFAIIVAINTFISDDPEGELERLCNEPGLESIASVSELCTHGPDPKDQFITEGVATAAAIDVTPVRPSQLCKGDGTSGVRVKAYMTYPANRPPADPAAERRHILQSMGYTERYLRESSNTYVQGIKWLCSSGAPAIADLPITAADGVFDDLDDAIAALPGEGEANRVHLFFATTQNFPYCGVGTIMGDGRSKAAGNPGMQHGNRAWSLISNDCMGFSDTTLHELGHNLGAVQPSAPHAGGDGWHGYEDHDAMSYNDGSAWYTCTDPFNVAGCGHTVKRCSAAEEWLFDCGKDDYWNPARPTTGTFANRWNTADSPILSVPRRK